MDEEKLRLSKWVSVADWPNADYSGGRDTSGIHNSLLYPDNPAWNSSCSCRNMFYQKKVGMSAMPDGRGTIDYRAEGRSYMQVVVVKAPKMLRGILKIMFKMKKEREE